VRYPASQVVSFYHNSPVEVRINMPYDETLADALRNSVADLEPEHMLEITERKMFGGLCMMLSGNMLMGVSGVRLLVRLGDDDMEAALALPYVSPMVHAGRSMKGFAYVDPTGFTEENELTQWLEKSVKYVRARQAEDADKPRKKRQ
jgi:TfoX/Sxy family transcriptional regulator of competence genes